MSSRPLFPFSTLSLGPDRPQFRHGEDSVVWLTGVSDTQPCTVSICCVILLVRLTPYLFSLTTTPQTVPPLTLSGPKPFLNLTLLLRPLLILVLVIPSVFFNGLTLLSTTETNTCVNQTSSVYRSNNKPSSFRLITSQLSIVVSVTRWNPFDGLTVFGVKGEGIPRHIPNELHCVRVITCISNSLSFSRSNHPHL